MTVKLFGPIIHAVPRTGRPTSPRTTELGRYIQGLRGERDWSVLDLAQAAGVSHKTLSRLELKRYRLRKPDILLRIAEALEIHPDQLLLRAELTPMLRPSAAVPPSEIPEREPLTLSVTREERRHLETYLYFMRFMSSIIKHPSES